MKETCRRQLLTDPQPWQMCIVHSPFLFSILLYLKSTLQNMQCWSLQKTKSPYRIVPTVYEGMEVKEPVQFCVLWSKPSQLEPSALVKLSVFHCSELANITSHVELIDRDIHIRNQKNDELESAKFAQPIEPQ